MHLVHSLAVTRSVTTSGPGLIWYGLCTQVWWGTMSHG